MPLGVPGRVARDAQEVRSPCVNICEMNPQTGYCKGCLRTIDEIACWSGYTVEEKFAVLARLAPRKATLAP